MCIYIYIYIYNYVYNIYIYVYIYIYIYIYIKWDSGALSVYISLIASFFLFPWTEPMADSTSGQGATKRD